MLLTSGGEEEAYTCIIFEPATSIFCHGSIGLRVNMHHIRNMYKKGGIGSRANVLRNGASVVLTVRKVEKEACNFLSVHTLLQHLQLRSMSNDTCDDSCERVTNNS